MIALINSLYPTNRLRFAALCFVISIFSLYTHGQTLTTNYGGFAPCSGPLALYEFDFSNTINNTITQANISTANADNECCGLSPNNHGCSIFEIITDPNAVGVSLTVDGPCGSITLNYLNCGSTYSCGDIICLDNSQSVHRFLMCRPGGPEYDFTFTQYLGPSVSPDIITAVGCSLELSVTGLNNPVWTSVFPTPNGAYDGNLDCLTCSNTTFTPTNTTPTTVLYQVSGTISSVCASSLEFIDTVEVTTYPTLSIDAGPDLAICNGTLVGATITATAEGGFPPYDYTWTNAGTTISSTLNSQSPTNNITVMEEGTYVVTVVDSTGCSVASDTVNVVEFLVDIVANAGQDTTLCGTPLPLISLNGSVSGTGTGYWSEGNGTYSIDSADLTLVYEPAPSEIAAGSVMLTLIPSNTYGCPSTPDTIIITLAQFTGVIDGSVEDVSCFGGSDGEISVNVVGGEAVSNYEWSPITASTPNVDNLTVGDYQVIVTDINGCSDTAVFNVSQPDELVLTLDSVTAVSCNAGNNGCAYVSAEGGTPGYAYQLLDNSLNLLQSSVNPQFCALTAGSYFIVVVDANLCSDTIAAEVTQPSALNIAVSSIESVSCNSGDDGCITVLTTGGTPSYEYELQTVPVSTSTFSSLSQFCSLSAGDYLVIVTDQNGCIDDIQVTVEQPDTLQLTVDTFTNVLCYGQSNGTIEVLAAGGVGGYEFQIISPIMTPLQSNGLFQNLPAGNYTIVVFDDNGCSDTIQQTIIQPDTLSISLDPSVFASGSNISCFDESDGEIDVTVGGGTQPYTYEWIFPVGGCSTCNPAVEDQSNLGGAPSPGLEYEIIITDANNCVIQGGIFLVEPPELILNAIPFEYPSQDNISCYGSSDGQINLIPSGGSPEPTSPFYSFEWTGPGSFTSSQEDLINLPAGNYFVTATDLNGCTDTLTIVLVQPDSLWQDTTLSLYASGDNISCFGANDGSIDYTINGGSPTYEFSWSTINGSGIVPTNEDQDNLSAGTYEVVVEDINGCTITGTFVLTEPSELTADIALSVYANSFNVTGCDSNGTIDLSVSGGSPGYDISWSSDDPNVNFNPGSLNQVGLWGAEYSVTIIDTNGCSVTIDTVLTQAPPFDIEASVTTNYNGADISCYDASDGGLTVVVNGGVPVYSYEWTNISSPGVVISTLASPALLPEGTYIVSVTDQDNCTTLDTISLSQPPAFLYNIGISSNYNGEDISCFGAADGSIDLAFSGGTPTYNVLWTLNGNIVSTDEDPVDLSEGTYIVVVTDVNNCIFDTLITLNQPDLVSGTAEVTSFYNGSDVSCYESTDGSVTVNPVGGTPGYTYEWISSNVPAGMENNQSVFGVGAGNYVVEITDVNGCQHTTSVTVTQPTELLSSTSILTNYFGVGVSCVGASDGAAQVTAGGGIPAYTYSWSSTPIQSGAVAVGLGVGTFTCTVTDANGCQSSSFVTLMANPVPEINLPAAQNDCYYNEITFEAPIEPGGSCNWEFSNGFSSNEFGPFGLTFPSAGCFDLVYTVTNALGCSSTVEIEDYVCAYPAPNAGFTSEPGVIDAVDNGVLFNNTSQDAVDYIWSFGDSTGFSNQENPYHQFNEDDDFNSVDFQVILAAINEYGCIDTSIAFITYNPALVYYVPNCFTPDGDDYNNSFKPVFSSGYSTKNYAFMIFDRWGELIFETKDVGEAWDGTYKGQPCQDGVYTWKIAAQRSDSANKFTDIGHVSLLRGMGDDR